MVRQKLNIYTHMHAHILYLHPWPNYWCVTTSLHMVLRLYELYAILWGLILFSIQIIQEQSPKHSVEVCITAENKNRNRYANIQCCKYSINKTCILLTYICFFTVDHSRCMLQSVGGYGNDYINANFIDVSMVHLQVYVHV